MASYSNKQRENSLLGALNVGKTGQSDMSLKDLTENDLNKEQFLRHNLIRKLRTIEFFKLDETPVHVRNADWLEYICWTPATSDWVQKQNQLLSSPENEVDNLLKAAFDLLDVNESSTVNKVLDQATEQHLSKIATVYKRICQGYPAF